MAFELEVLVGVLFGGLVGAVVGGVISVVLGARYARKHMVRETVWKHKVEAYGRVMKDLSYLELITGLVLTWVERLKDADRDFVSGYLRANIDVLEGFVLSEFPGMKEEFENVKECVKKCPEGDILRDAVLFLMKRIGIACWGRMTNSVRPLRLLVEKGSGVDGIGLAAHGLWHEIQKEPESFDDRKVMSFWRDFTKRAESAMKDDLKTTLCM